MSGRWEPRGERRTATGPLRAVVRDAAGEDGLVYDVLECGHWLVGAGHAYDGPVPRRRRCRRCAAPAPRRRATD